MKRLPILAALVVILGSVFVLTIHFRNQNRSTVLETDKAAVGTFATRNHLVTVYAGDPESGGSFYSVATRGGKILTDLLDETAMSSEFPDLYQQLKRGIAGSDIWAGLDERLKHPDNTLAPDMENPNQVLQFSLEE